MTRQKIRTAVTKLPVFDTHTHLNMPNIPIAARNFWDIGHYFWFLRELIAAGYSPDAEKLPERERINRFIEAFHATRNTSMNWVVRHIFRDLYDLEISDADSIQAADNAIRRSSKMPDWPQKVIDRLTIKRIGTNSLEDSNFRELPNVGCAIPENIGVDRRDLKKSVLSASNQQLAGEKAAQEISSAIAVLVEKGIHGIRIDPDPFGRIEKSLCETSYELPVSGASEQQVEIFLANAVFKALCQNGMFAQLFLGVEHNKAAGGHNQR